VTGIIHAIAHTTDTSALTLTTARYRITMGKKKKHDSEVSGNSVKKDVRPNRVPLPVDLARLRYDN
jgi:hypothetical protein